MCIICTEYMKSRITTKEAVKAAQEMAMFDDAKDMEHLLELLEGLVADLEKEEK